MNSLTNFTGFSSQVNALVGLRISYCPSLVSLNGLGNILNVQDMSIESNATLNSLLGLNNLKIVNGDLKIVNNNILSNLSSLNQINKIKGKLTILGNPLITTLSGLNSLTFLGSNLIIKQNNGLTNLNGLNSLTTLGIGGTGVIDIQDNPALNSLSALSNLTSSNLEITINRNHALPNLNGIGSIGNNIQKLDITFNNLLSSLTTFINLSHVDRLSIFQNPALTSLAGLENITKVNYLTVTTNNALTSFAGLTNLVEVVNDWSVSSNTTFTGFNSLTTVDNLYVGGNVTNLMGLSSLKTVKNTLQIFFRPSIVDLTGVTNLTYIGNLSVTNNPLLTSLNGLNQQIAISGFSIRDNPLLNSCAIQPICNALAYSQGPRVILNNGINCNSNAAVNALCTPSAPPIPHFTASKTPVCAGSVNQVYTINNNNTGGTFNWTYSGTGVTIIPDVIPSFIMSAQLSFANNATSGTLSVTATSSNGTSQASTLPIIVGPPPPPEIYYAGTTLTIFSGRNAYLNASNSCAVSGGTVRWYNQAGGTLLQIGDSFVTPVLSSSTPYYVECYKEVNCTSNRNQVLVTVIVEPPVQPDNFTTSTNAVCQGLVGIVYTIPNVSGVTYNWSYSGSGATINGSGNSVIVDFANNATSGTLSVTATNGAGTSPARTLAITVNAVPSSAPTASGVTIASGNAASLTATGCFIYKWYSQATGGTVTFTGQNFTTPPLTSTTNYYVACNPGNACESPRVLVTVTVPCTQMVSVKTGVWNDPTVWSCNRIPTATDDITIETGHIVTVPAGTFQVKNVTDKGTLGYALNGVLNILGGS